MIIGQMALSKFPMWEMCLSELSLHCDKLFLRVEMDQNLNKKIEKISEICKNKLGDIFIASEPFHKWKWREQLIRMLDEIKPEIVISIDEDEILDKSIDQEILEFKVSDKKCMMVGYNPMPTKLGKIILNNKPYPLYPHCKVLKWQPGINYNNYHGNALPPMYHSSICWWKAKSKITHYCFYEESWYEQKVKTMKIYSVKNYFKTYYGTTLNGFDT